MHNIQYMFRNEDLWYLVLAEYVYVPTTPSSQCSGVWTEVQIQHFARASLEIHKVQVENVGYTIHLNHPLHDQIVSKQKEPPVLW